VNPTGRRSSDVAAPPHLDPLAAGADPADIGRILPDLVVTLR
jgi:hypothetical protein